MPNSSSARLLNPTNEVGGSFILSLQKDWPHPSPNPTNAVGGSFILSLQKGMAAPFPKIPPTQLVDRSYSAYKTTRAPPVPNPTNAVGGLFIFSAHALPSEKLSTARSAALHMF